MTVNMCAPCLLGLEGLAADELRRMNMTDVRAENGRVLFSGGLSAIAKANLRLATAERVMILLGEFKASSFDELFEGTRALGWEEWIPSDGAFPVRGYCLDSKLYSVPDCQKIIKKAVVERMKLRYRTSWFREDGAKYQIRFSIMNDRASLYIDTTGTGLHKRGYRLEGNAAPLRETLAAAIVKLSRYRGREQFCDPFCGSGTIPIEAAFAAKNRAPGLLRGFEAERWQAMGAGLWQSAREEAVSGEYAGAYDIWGGDIDPKCVGAAENNAARAGVRDLVRFETADAAHFAEGRPGGILAANPPYGERVMEVRDAERLYALFGKAAARLVDWKLYILSSHADFERFFGKPAVKKRKLYNGMIKCDLYMYY